MRSKKCPVCNSKRLITEFVDGEVTICQKCGYTHKQVRLFK